MPQNEQEGIEEIESSEPSKKSEQPYKLTVRVFTTKEGKEIIIPEGESFDLHRKGSIEPYLRVTVVAENEVAIILDPLKFGDRKEG